MEYQGYDISAAQSLIPKLQQLLISFRSGGFPIYHTREGQSHNIIYRSSLTLFQAIDPICPLSRAGNRIALATMPRDLVLALPVLWAVYSFAVKWATILWMNCILCPGNR